MATLAVQNVTRDGLEVTYAAAASGGDEFVNTGHEFLHVKNGDVAAKVVTLVTQATVDGQAVADRDVVVANGTEALIGPFPVGTYNDADNKVQLTYDAVTSLTVAVLKV